MGVFDILGVLIAVIYLIMDMVGKFGRKNDPKTGGDQRKRPQKQSHKHSHHSHHEQSHSYHKPTPEELCGGCHDKTGFIATYNAAQARPIRGAIVTVDDIPAQLQYRPGQKIVKSSLHIGQRKLFLNEVQFMTAIRRKQTQDDRPVLVVYAGAAPNNKGGDLARLFPEVTWLLVDPNPFNIFGAQPNVITQIADVKPRELNIINDLFTDDLARECAKVGDTQYSVYFISDIRTNVDEGGAEPGDIDILWNLAQQYIWAKIMKPRLSMFKFRLPFYETAPDDLRKSALAEPYASTFKTAREFGIDFIGDATVVNPEMRRLNYFDGVINLQPWPGVSSTETRLVTDGNTITSYDHTYDDKLYYYNSIERPYVKHINGNADRRIGFDHCNDCALENAIWCDYFGVDPSVRNADVQSKVNALTKTVGRPLLREKHGRLF